MTSNYKEVLIQNKIDTKTVLLGKDILIEELKLHQEELLAQPHVFTLSFFPQPA
jgi:hypothetical protein